MLPKIESEENPMESAANITLALAEMCYAKAKVS